MSWEVISTDSQILAIHAAVLPTNEILYFGGDQHCAACHNSNDIDHTRLYNITTGAISTISSPTTDIFCAGHSFLSDGRLLVGGGTEQWGGVDAGHAHDLNFGGHRACWVYNPRLRNWTRVADMNFEPGRTTGGGRWYPTLITLPNGDVLMFFGHPSRTDTRHRNNSVERYSPALNTWALLPPIAQETSPISGGRFLNYPRVHVLPNGQLFFATPTPVSEGGSINHYNRFYDPSTRAFVGVNIAPPSGNLYVDWFGTSVLLPLLPGDGYTPRVMVCGDVQPHRINLGDATPAWQNAGSRTGAAVGRRRENLCAVILPTGEVFISGGVENSSNDATAVREGEIYNPGIDWSADTYTGSQSWVSTEAATVTRNYHSVALLMPNGRVWTAGSSKNANQGNPNDSNIAEKRIEIYKPAYDADPNRPEITAAPVSITYGQSFEVRSPQASSIERVGLIRAGSVTHAFDADQRYVGLVFDQSGGDRLTVTAPPSANIAPPGNYMLWIVDNEGRPCQLAKFVRVARQQCFIITDRSTFSSYEVEALPSPANFPEALYVVFDGFLPPEIGTPPTPPTATLTFDSPSGGVVPGMSAVFNRVLFENPAVPPDLTQRITFVFDIRFDSTAAFATFAETRNVNIQMRLGHHICNATLNLIKQPNPYMLDGAVHWLSTDVRVFQIRSGQSRGGVVHGSGNAAPYTFIQQLLNAFNSAPNNTSHPFLGIPEDQQNSRLELSREVDGQQVYNYAIGKVRYRAASVPAPDVRVFFRLFSTVGTALNFNPFTTYRRSGTGANTVPLLGLQGNDIITIPFFAEPRVNTAIAPMTTQTDSLNQRTLNPAGADEFVAYFGCWLDFNQTTPQFPLHPTDDGPYTDRLSIQQLIRGQHQCLVAEVYFEPDSIPFGATPGTSDNLSQRNLAIVESDNPGSLATHTVQHTFEIKPSEGQSDIGIVAINRGIEFAAVNSSMGRPDELMIRWNNLPQDTRVTLYLPDVQVDDILALTTYRLSPSNFEKVDDHTIRCPVGDITYVPLPGGRNQNIAGLITLELPETVKRGQLFTVTVQQYAGYSQAIIGAFQITIPVSVASLLLPQEIRKLSVLRHIATAIPPGDRWYPIFVRYLDQIADRVRGLGGNPDAVAPSPDGTGQPEPVCDCWAQWLLPGILAPLIVLLGIIPTLWAAPLAAIGIILLLVAIWYWRSQCQPTRCDWITAAFVGVAIGGGVLGFITLTGYQSANLLSTLAGAGILSGVLVIAAMLQGCWGQCWNLSLRSKY